MRTVGSSRSLVVHLSVRPLLRMLRVVSPLSFPCTLLPSGPSTARWSLLSAVLPSLPFSQSQEAGSYEGATWPEPFTYSYIRNRAHDTAGHEASIISAKNKDPVTGTYYEAGHGIRVISAKGKNVNPIN